MSDDDLPICALCDRRIPKSAKQSLHHLIPKLKGGRSGPTVLLHQICHNEIHANLSEAELARVYNTPEKLREHPQIAKFVKWVKKRPDDFYARSKGGDRRRRSR